MKTTSVSLLERLQIPDPKESDWQLLHGLYAPLIRHWIERVPGIREEAADLTQEVMVVLLKEIPHFRRQRKGSFRAWLRQVTVNQLRSYRKRQKRNPVAGVDETELFLDRLGDPESELSQRWNAEHDNHVLHQMLSIVEIDFGEQAWLAFKRFALEGLSAAQVAEETGLSENAVIKTKSRILKRLRQEAEGFLE
ncbi:MAG: sigma-70 family RNA polymerase sigma factor [Planctomycetaceae bacterium]